MKSSQEIVDEVQIYINYICKQLKKEKYFTYYPRCYWFISRKVNCRSSTIERIRKKKIKIIPAFLYLNIKELHTEFQVIDTKYLINK